MTSSALPSLLPGDRVLIYYGRTDSLWRERYLAEPVGGTAWIVITPDFALYKEDLLDNLGVQKLDSCGNAPRGVVISGGVYRFNEAKLKRQLPKLRREAADAVTRLVVLPPAAAAAAAPAQAASGPLVDAGDAASSRPKARDDGRIWVFLETRGGYHRGDPVPENLLLMAEVGDRAVVVDASLSIAAMLQPLPHGELMIRAAEVEVLVGTLSEIGTTPRVRDDGGHDLRVSPAHDSYLCLRNGLDLDDLYLESSEPSDESDDQDEKRQAARGLNLEEKPDEADEKKGPKAKAEA